MEAVTFVKCSPASNMTILVLSELPQEQHAPVAAQMMAYAHLHAEQVGFVSASTQPGVSARLSMAGGEFCGNAALSLAACLASERQLPPGDPWELAIEVTGAAAPIACRVERTEVDYVCEAVMPLPRAIEQVSLPFEGRSLEVGIVRYCGSFHLVVDLERCPLDLPAAERLARLLGVASGEALVGVMLYQLATREMTPLIYLPALDSLIWEQGCGSGSASLGSYLAWREEAPVQLDLEQPGGTIGVTVACTGQRLVSVHIKSRVSIVATGTAYVRPSVHYPLLSGGIL
ncbi:hypothetical protein PA598K_04284 [Paenibacillus sp. 598K]|uniref:diaminopimelate epimerase n=1 Tax=Paenibacillus sp. 598K TaxID=1117987 RepID=UPI000FF986DC|nr:diaminopimelate epimerase [Paenibacillus sp. 598K]GBF75852.1 hypothetical protein PA598K_04284 [Paenibacillus sp. 598K]